MYLLYLDDSGSVDNQNESYLVLGGVCVFEAQVDWFTTEIDKIAQRFRPEDPDSVEFHATDVFGGRVEPWKSLKKKEERQAVLKEVLGILPNAFETARAFAAVVHKPSCRERHPMELAFEVVCSRFNKFLSQTGVNDRGLIILDETAHATRLHQLSKQFRKLGTQWGGVHRIIDAPMFVSSRSFRCMQLADHIAYAVFRRFEAKDTNYFDVFAHRFDRVGKTIFGLQHIETGASPTCMCPCCLSGAVRRPNGI
jgi:hypothetical protein